MSASLSDRIYGVVKGTLKAPFDIVGLELRRRSPPSMSGPPPLYEDPFEALYVARGGERAAFQCPIDRIVDLKALGFHRDRWHPFVAAIEERRLRGDSGPESLLRKFYTVHQPRNAGEAILGFNNLPALFRRAAPHLYYLSPWSAFSPDKVDSLVRLWNDLDNSEHGAKGLDIDSHGFLLHGPIHEDKMRFEIKRLLTVTESIRTSGFDRSFGDANVRMLKRGGELLYVVDGGGYHRTAAMAALGYPWIPASLFPGPFVIDVSDVGYWPQVRRGVWEPNDAIAYFNHLFDFDSRAWAIEHGVTE